MAKERIDVEALLVWAYREQKVDRTLGIIRASAIAPLSMASTSAVMAEVAALGVRVQTSGGGLAALGADVAVDAAAVHDAVLALPDILIVWREDDEAVILLEEEVRATGRLEQGASGRMMFVPRVGRTVPAEVYVSTVRLIGHARNADRPDWCEEGMRVLPYAYDDRGRPALEEIDGRLKAACPITYVPPPRAVMMMRAQYLAWHRAMADLATTLGADMLDRFTVDRPSAPAVPWGKSGRQPVEKRRYEIQPSEEPLETV